MRIGVVGAGTWGRNHVQTLHEMGILSAVVEIDPELQVMLRGQFPDVPVFPTLDSFSANGKFEEVEAFVVATPAHTHAELACRLFEMGKHVLVEKPMALSVADAKTIVKAAQRADKKLMVGHLLLFQPGIQFIKNYLEGGELGKVFTLTQRRSKLGRARKVENVLWSFGVHDVAVLLFLAGEAPTHASAFGHSAVTEGIEDDVHLHMRFRNGSVANLHNSWLWPRIERELIIIGEKGILIFDEMNQRVILHRKGINADLQNRDDGEEFLFEGADQPLRLELEHFSDCCRNRSKPIADGQNGIDVIQVLENAQSPEKSFSRLEPEVQR